MIQSNRLWTPHERPTAVALGFFDGVHLGHGSLLRLAAKKNIAGITHSAAWSFRIHPDICMKKPTARILTSYEQKLNLFRSYGIDLAIFEDFEAVRDCPADEFLRDNLFDRCRVRAAVCGYNFTFGKDAKGKPGLLCDVLSKMGAAVLVLPPASIGDEPISSSRIRNLIECGDTETAKTLLGHPFSIFLPVTEGRKIGRTIGVPTINQVFPEYYAVPRRGVYACRILVDGVSHIGVSNVGVRPTISEGSTVNCETHIIDFSGWLYGKKIEVDFYKFLRDEVRFPDITSLKAAIDNDIATTKAYFGK